VNDCLDKTLAIWIAFDVALVAVACLLVVFFEPIAQGSGVPG
jgi:hypothetical protein